jgi:7-cyano-7-deazaguanine reductase
MEKTEHSVLGKKVSYPSGYDPSVLVAVPRIENRISIGFNDDQKMFVGYDTWHAYEAGFLLNTGMPVAGLLKLVYPSSSPNIVESKSLKLYLNSFNMHRFIGEKKIAIDEFVSTICSDLTAVLGIEPSAHFFENEVKMKEDFAGYDSLEHIIDIEKLIIEHYNERAELLVAESSEPSSFKLASALLRSNCKVTFQPDWGSVFIQMKSDISIDKASLLKYIVSFRTENHFHEEICETIYVRLWEKFKPEELAVTCIYTRRGGIDICPTRASNELLLPDNLINPESLTPKLLRQ